jgi:hypothetical protein
LLVAWSPLCCFGLESVVTISYNCSYKELTGKSAAHITFP